MEVIAPELEGDGSLEDLKGCVLDLSLSAIEKNKNCKLHN